MIHMLIAVQTGRSFHFYVQTATSAVELAELSQHETLVAVFRHPELAEAVADSLNAMAMKTLGSEIVH